MNWHEARTEQQLREANASLRSMRNQLWELNQPPEVRAALHARSANHARATQWGVRIVLGLGALWCALSLVFGRAGARLFGGLLSILLDAVGVLFVVGGVVWVGGILWRAARWLAGRGAERP